MNPTILSFVNAAKHYKNQKNTSLILSIVERRFTFMLLKLTAYYLNRKSLLTRLLLVQQLTWAFLSTMAVLPLSLFTSISHCPVYTCHKCHINSNSLLAAHTYFDIIDVTSIRSVVLLHDGVLDMKRFYDNESV